MSRTKIVPQGLKLLVLPTKGGELKTAKEGLVVVQTELTEGTVVEVSDALSEIYKPGDTVIYPSASGISQVYKGQPHLWLNGSGAPTGDIWATVVNEKANG